MRTNCLDTREPNSPRSTVEVQPYAYRYVIRINDVIGPPSEWVEEISAIQNSGPNDVIHIYCNSPGGSLYTATEILSAMLQTDAHIITELTGEACSAAALIFLAGDEFRVSDDGTLMNHGASYGVYGTQQQVYDNVVSSQKQLTKLARKYYAGFLSEEEIEKLIEGKEFWMDAPEIIQRLEKRSKFFKDKLNKEQAEAESLEEIGDIPSEDELKGMSKQELIDFILGKDLEETEEKEVPQDENTLWKSSDGLWSSDDADRITLNKDQRVLLCCAEEGSAFYEGDLWIFDFDGLYQVTQDQRKVLLEEMDYVGLTYNVKSSTSVLGRKFQNYLISIINEYLEATGSDKIPTL